MNDEFAQDYNSQAAVLLMKELTEKIDSLRVQVTNLDRSVTYYRATQEESIEKAINKALHKAFPEGDPEGHRRHHEAVIKAAEDRAVMWKKARNNVAEWGAVGLVAWIIQLVWTGVLVGPKS